MYVLYMLDTILRMISLWSTPLWLPHCWGSLSSQYSHESWPERFQIAEQYATAHLHEMVVIPYMYVYVCVSPLPWLSHFEEPLPWCLGPVQSSRPRSRWILGTLVAEIWALSVHMHHYYHNSEQHSMCTVTRLPMLVGDMEGYGSIGLGESIGGLNRHSCENYPTFGAVFILYY